MSAPLPTSELPSASRGTYSLQRVVRGHIVATLILGDCQEMLPMKCDAIVCDPPYPDYHAEAYGYADGLLEPLRMMDCRQIIFWSSKVEFPLPHSAIHIWDKKTGCGSQYERIYERNGQANYKVYRHYLINSTVAASYTGDEWTGHPSQKPVRLMQQIILDVTKEGDTVLDPWMGSGSTGLACMMTGRNFVGIEKNPTHYATACSRLEREANQGVLL